MKISLCIRLAIAALACIALARPAAAQQRPQYSQYMNNNFLLNPALAGTADGLDARMGLRLQWAGFKDAPRSIYATVHKALGRLPAQYRGRSKYEKSFHHGVGAIIQADITGPTSRTSAYLAYSYNQPLTKKLKVSFGLMLGLQQFSLNGNKLLLADPTAASIAGVTKIFPDAGVGLWLYTPKFFFGGSILQIFRNQFSTNDATQGIYTANRHGFVTTGLNLRPSKDWTIVPSILVKSVAPAPISVDFNTKFRYQNKVWGGLSFRTQDALVLMAGINLPSGFEFGYSYDIVFSSISRYQVGSHEIMLAYRVKPQRRTYNPSDFWK